MALRAAAPRQDVGREHSVSKEEWLASRGGRFFSEGFLD